eukprot:Lankesteria_metandrocarpae@DN4136_c0_g1_i1.p1
MDLPLNGALFLENRERRLKLLEERRSRYEDSVQCEFTADEAIIGLIIGKQGEKLTRVARENKVEIRVLPDDGGLRRIRIYGTDNLCVERARNLLEYVHEEYCVPEIMISWITSKKGGVSIREVQQKSRLHSAWFDDINRIVCLCGLRQSVNHAVKLLNNFVIQFQASTHHVLPMIR